MTLFNSHVDDYDDDWDDWTRWDNPKRYCEDYEAHRLYHAIGERCPCHIDFGSDRISVPTFQVVSCPKVSIEEVKNRRFNIIKKAEELTDDDE